MMPKNPQRETVGTSGAVLSQFLDGLRALRASAGAVAALSPQEIRAALRALDEGSGITVARLLEEMGEVERQFVRIKSVLLLQP